MTYWHVLVSDDEISLLDHRYMVFQVGDLEFTRLTLQNSKANQLGNLSGDTKANVEFIPKVTHSVQDLEPAAGT